MVPWGSLGPIFVAMVSILSNEMEPKANSVAAYAEDETGGVLELGETCYPMDMKNTLRVFEAECGQICDQLTREELLRL